ncbi:hypothetical protein HDU87_001199 [Geranomyces variabilis]|uniref:Uncharacterized protein n=1 Tax=Geranomyces variabilis TaxID=109894 RepID=A0AAD5TBB8_9FUNG|nr:hypothetical protein HDU87_001199 [Geranomyces variabilis]
MSTTHHADDHSGIAEPDAAYVTHNREPSVRDSYYSHDGVASHKEMTPSLHYRTSHQAWATAPHRAGLAFAIAIFATLISGPFAYLLFCFYTTARTRFAVFTGLAIVFALQGIATVIAGKVVSQACDDSADKTAGGTACDTSYGFSHRTGSVDGIGCATTCESIWKACLYSAIIFWCLGGIAVGGAISSGLGIRKAKFTEV